MPSQVLFKLAEDLVTCFFSQVVDFDETGVVIDSNRPLSKNPLPYLPVYKSIPCISRPPILGPKNTFFLFLCKNFLEKTSLLP